MSCSSQQELLRNLPKVDDAISWVAACRSDFPPMLVKRVVQEEIVKERQALLAGESSVSLTQKDWQKRFCYAVSVRLSPKLKRVINATGVVIHTNLGRSILSGDMLASLNEAGGHYANLEFNLITGKRGSRYSLVEELLCELTGAEAALVVNNNAAAVLLSLDTLAAGKEVIVSRGQLVEIGGSFRIPDVMAKSGAKLVEVGATNRTHLRDYEEALTDRTAMLLRVHTSNFRIIGFTAEISAAEMSALAR
ncbi:MAG: L-seryl-tRNA(Sec) selenium transferase, partial [Desulfobacterales bacterium]